MKIAIRGNEIFLEKNWQEHFKNDIVDKQGNLIVTKKDLTQSPYNYTIIEIIDDIDFDKLQRQDIVNNVFDKSIYDARIQNETNKEQEIQDFNTQYGSVIADKETNILFVDTGSSNGTMNEGDIIAPNGNIYKKIT